MADIITESTEEDETEENVAIVVEVFAETAALVNTQPLVAVSASVSCQMELAGQQ